MKLNRELQLVLALFLTLLWVVATGGRGYAQTNDGVDVVNVDVSAYPQVGLTVDVPDWLSPSWTATVDENGVSQPAVIAEDVRGAIEIVLAVDTSGSMTGAPLDNAKAAAAAFVQQLPAGASAAVIGFSDSPYVVSPMTADKTALVTAIDSLGAGGETSLYDALDLATAQFSASPEPRSVVLVSDGGDTTSASTLDQATTRLVDAKARLFALRMATSETNDGTLDTLALATHGRAVDGVNAGDLANAYQQIAGGALHQVRLTYQSTAHGTTPVRVELAGGSTRSSVTVSVPLPAEAETTTAPRSVGAAQSEGAGSSSSQLVLGGTTLFVGLVALLLTVVTRPPKSLLADRRRSTRSSSLSDLKGALGAAMERTLERRGQRDALRRLLETAGIALRPGEYLLLVAGASGLGGFTGLVIGGGAVALVFALAVVAGAWLVLCSRTTKRRATFERQLPDLLQQLTSTLRAGYGIMQALDTVSRETEAPMRDELRRVVNEVQLGRPLTDSLDAMADRVGCEDFLWVVQAIQINAEVGGDLVEVLDAVAGTVRARAHLRRQIKTLSAQGRLSARILLMMPFIMAVLLSLIHPGYLAPLVGTSIGPILLGVGGMLMTVGWLWLRRIVRLQF